MKNKKLLVFRNFIVKILVNFTVIFSMLAAFDIVVSSLLGNKTGNFYMWIMIVLFAIIISVILYFIFKINKISILAQIVITYSVVSIGTYVQGYVVRIFSIHDLSYVNSSYLTYLKFSLFFKPFFRRERTGRFGI